MPAPEWVVEQWPGSATVIAVRSHGTRDGRPTDETRYYVSSLRTGALARRASACGRPCSEPSASAGQSKTAGTGCAMCLCGKTPTATGRTTASKFWPPSAAWPSMPCGSMESGRSPRASPPWLTTSGACSGCWGGESPRRQRATRDDF